MRIIDWARDNNITWVEDIGFWILKVFGSKVYNLIRRSALDRDLAEHICRKHFNQIGFHWGFCELSRLIGFGDDEEDFYYITKSPKGKIVWNSMVGGFCGLKGRIPKWDYNNLESTYSNNGCPPEKEFLSLFEPSKFSFDTFSEPLTDPKEML